MLEEAAYADLAFIISLKRRTLIFCYPQAAAASASQMMHTLIKTRAAGYLAQDLF
jgi:hypothetical protein